MRANIPCDLLCLPLSTAIIMPYLFRDTVSLLYLLFQGALKALSDVGALKVLPLLLKSMV